MNKACDFECSSCSTPCYKAKHVTSLDKIRKKAAETQAELKHTDN